MSRSKHSEAQFIAALKQVEAGGTADDVARECGVSKHTIYAWKAKRLPIKRLQDLPRLWFTSPAPTFTICSIPAVHSRSIVP
jgi:hypothetical protein